MSATATPEKTAANDLAPLTAQVRSARTEAKQELVERGEVIDLLWSAIIAREHGVLLGPPGTAKSMLIRAVLSHITGVNAFEILLNKDTPPELMYGPLSLKGMKEDRVERLTEGFSPQAHVIFSDEIFKANSTVLNGLLALLNERKFHNGRRVDDSPLMSMFGASNEFPQDELLRAFADRLPLRFLIPEVTSTDGLMQIIDGFLTRWQGDRVATSHTEIPLAAIQQLQHAATHVTVSDEIRRQVSLLFQEARGEGLGASVRRLTSGLKLAMVNALLNDETELKRHHLRVFMHVLWDDEDQVETADNLTIGFAGRVTMAARKHRAEFEDYRTRLTTAQGDMPSDGTLTTDLTTEFRNVMAGLTDTAKRIDDSIAEAETDGEDPAELISLREDVKNAHKAAQAVLIPGLD